MNSFTNLQTPDGWSCDKLPSKEILNLPKLSDTISARLEIVDENDFFITGASVIFSQSQKSIRINVFPNQKILFYHPDIFPFGREETEILVDFATNTAYAISAEKKCQKIEKNTLDKEM